MLARGARLGARARGGARGGLLRGRARAGLERHAWRANQAGLGRFPRSRVARVLHLGGSVHGEPANFARIVLSCIEKLFWNLDIEALFKALSKIYTMHFLQLSEAVLFFCF